MQKTLVVADTDELNLDHLGLTTLSFDQYLSDYPKLNEPKTRVINLCDTEHYLSRGYYCSLLAEARQHRVMPSVSTINDLRETSLSTFKFSLEPGSDKLLPLDFLVFFGWTETETLKASARKLFSHFPAPILRVRISMTENQPETVIDQLSFQDLNMEQQALFITQLEKYTHGIWRTPSSKRKARWDIAILVDPDETHPPSDKEAINRFVKAASKVGMHAELITAKDATQLAQFDALFIRETTAIDHHTYRLARKAEREGLIVMDDSTSILRCCNKVFLHDAFNYNGVPSLKTRVISSGNPLELQKIEDEFSYPLIIKVPEGSFSRGVFKVENREQLESRVSELLKESALLLAQEYLFTDFDWRVGVLNGRALYACKYYMARNHWQIYNHAATKRHSSGDFETLPTFEVPRVVLDAALKASAMIGKGLYGVDLKQRDREVFVIEVNDNPSIDHKVEDVYLGNELYMQIMSEFVSRLELRGK